MTVIKTLSFTNGTVVTPPWDAEQVPYVRGVTQDRITAVAGVTVPGDTDDPFRPASAMRVEVRPFHDNDITVTATAAATDSATTLTMSTADAALLYERDFLVNTRTGETLRVTGAPSGTSVPVLRGVPNTSAAAINSGDTFTVPCGDVSDSGSNYPASRAEVLVDLPSPTSTPPALWPNPPGSERWFHWSTYVPSSFIPASTGTDWLTFLQIKGLRGGSPPLGMEIQRNNWRFGGTRGNVGAWPNNGIIKAIEFDTWTNFVLGVKLSPDASVGWVELWCNEQLVIPRQSIATMDYQSDGTTPDPVYIKMGIYQNTTWASTNVLYHGEMTIADSGVDFDVVQAPPSGSATVVNEYWGMLL